MIKRIFFQQPDYTIVDFDDGKTARLSAITLGDLRKRDLPELKAVEIIPDLIDKDRIWSTGTHTDLDEIFNVFERENKYYLEIGDSEELISAREFKTLLSLGKQT